VSQVNLLPPDVLQAQRVQRTTTLVAIAGMVLLLLVFGFYLVQNGRLGAVNDEIEAQEASNASIQASIAEKQRFADLQAEAQARQQVLAGAYAGEVSFSALLMDFSRVIPSDAYVDSLSVQAAAETGEVDPAAGAGAASLVGTITTSGQAVSIDTLSAFLTRLEQVKGWVNPWVPSVTKDDVGFSYALSVDLTDDVVTERGKSSEGATDAAG
jgi:Tfp pilus assembly protein PilN